MPRVDGGVNSYAMKAPTRRWRLHQLPGISYPGGSSERSRPGVLRPPYLLVQAGVTSFIQRNPSFRLHAGHAFQPADARMRSATTICCSRLACHARGAKAVPPYERQLESANCSPPENPLAVWVVQSLWASQYASRSHTEPPAALAGCRAAAGAGVFGFGGEDLGFTVVVVDGGGGGATVVVVTGAEIVVGAATVAVVAGLEVSVTGWVADPFAEMSNTIATTSAIAAMMKGVRCFLAVVSTVFSLAEECDGPPDLEIQWRAVRHDSRVDGF